VTGGRPARRPPATPRELELKYAVVDEAAVRRLVGGDSLAGLDAGPWRVVEVSDRYIDTPRRSLAAAGYGARIRHSGRGRMLTVKRDHVPVAGEGRSSRALHNRMELESSVGRGLDPRRWPESAARSVIESTSQGEPLRTLFEIRQRREERDLLREGEVVATLSLDSATVRRFGRDKGTFASLEIESVPVDGDDHGSVLDALGAVLDGSPALRPEPRSKAHIARQIIDQSLGGGRDMRPPRQPGVARDDALSEAGRKVLRMHMLRMLGAEPAVRAGLDPDPVRKMRVATRRMRAAWRTFSGAYRPREARRYVAELRTVADALGSVRDHDVQLERLSAYRAGAAENVAAGLEPLSAHWQHRREAARAALLDLLDSQVYERFTADYLAFVHTSGAGSAGGERVSDSAGGRIWRAYERLRAHDATLPWADAAALHAMRIDGKRLRYALEFFREVLEADADRLIADVTRLQDHLGSLNDANLTAQLTRAWLLDLGAGLTAAQREAAGSYLHANEAEVARLSRSFRPLWRVIVGRPFRRRLGSVVSGV
jgi:CHAD domain-containing protein